MARTILITAASLILGGLIPDSPKPLPSYTTAAGTTLLIASATLVYSYGRFAYLLVIDYSAPISFISHVVDPVTTMLNQQNVNTGSIVFRVPLLGQTLRYAIMRNDTETLYASLAGLQSIQQIYVQASTKNSSLRNHRTGIGNERKAWLGDELYRIYVGACEEALRSQSPQHEIDEILNYFGEATCTFISAHQDTESRQMMDGLTLLATSPYQVTLNATNYMTRPATWLASAEQCAEKAKQSELASYALANWAVAIAYPQVHFGLSYHPLFAEGVRIFGEHPPWTEVSERVNDPLWNSKWANQLQSQLDPVITVLEIAHDLHEGPGQPSFSARRKAVYIDWLRTTKDVAAGLVTNTPAFMHSLEGANYNVTIFGSPAVQSEVTKYLNSYQEISRMVSRNIGIAQGDELLRTLSDAFKQETIVAARASVLAAMNQDVGEDLE